MGFSPTRIVIMFLVMNLLVQGYTFYTKSLENTQDIEPNFGGSVQQQESYHQGGQVGRIQDINGDDLSGEIETIDIRANKDDPNAPSHSNIPDGVLRIHVKYCIGWSYRGTLMQMQQYIRAKIAEMQHNYDMDDAGYAIPKVEISGDNYEVGGSK